MKHFNLTSLPGLQNVENSNSSDLEALLLQMATDAETAALNPEAVVKTELTESEYEKYKIFQGIRHAFLNAINDGGLPSEFRASLVDELISLQSKNPLMYLDKCRHTLRSLIKQRTSGGIVFTETREREINSVLQVINLKKEHVIIEGATGLGKTVLAEAAVKRYLIQNDLFSVNSESNLEIDEVLEKDIKENLKETEYDFDGNFIMMNAAASTYEQLFGQIHIRKSDEGDVAETRFVPGIIYLAAEKGLPVILEEYNTVKDARVLKGLQTLMSADASSEITLELDPESGKVMTIRPKSGFTMVLTGNPLSKGAEGLTGVQKEDSAISSRCTRLIINQLPENELLQQFLVSQSLLDSNLGVNLPADVYNNLLGLIKMSVLIYKIKSGGNVLTKDQLDLSHISSQKIMDNLLSQRALSKILNMWKSNDYTDRIDDVILKVFLVNSLNVKEKQDELKLLYTLFSLNGFFNDGDRYPQIGDENLVSKLTALVAKIDLSPIEDRKSARVEIATLTLVERINAMADRYSNAVSSAVSSNVYTPFTKIFKDCFGAKPEMTVDLESNTIELDMGKVAYLKSLLDSILNDEKSKVAFDYVLGGREVPGVENYTFGQLVNGINTYVENPNAIAKDELLTLNQILLDLEFSDDIEFDTEDSTGGSQLDGQTAMSRLVAAFKA